MITSEFDLKMVAYSSNHLISWRNQPNKQQCISRIFSYNWTPPLHIKGEEPALMVILHESRKDARNCDKLLFRCYGVNGR